MNRLDKLKIGLRWNWRRDIIFRLWGESFCETARLGSAAIGEAILAVCILIAIPLYILKAVFFPVYHCLISPVWCAFRMPDSVAREFEKNLK
ncbi:hypothetical protein ACJJIE_03815 [Microbulbifer sp. TRSA001]|uniref:hypothetical protein n=1 Tax=Microbulbifer sp. TRSA001 TaxID=3243381 RepID=UPI00403A66A2